MEQTLWPASASGRRQVEIAAALAFFAFVTADAIDIFVLRLGNFAVHVVIGYASLLAQTTWLNYKHAGGARSKPAALDPITLSILGIATMLVVLAFASSQ